jgi:uncharacterized membrane protein YphA (DoxX/SURF4 family)
MKDMVMLDIALWVVQWVLAVAFVVSGGMKVVQPAGKLAEGMAWVSTVKPATVKVIGIAEILGGLGLILPVLTGIAPIVVPIAASALALVMVLAAIKHFQMNDAKGFAPSIVLFALSVVVAVARF